MRKPDHDEWPTITIVTPCLNQAPFLEASIRSVLDQDYPHIDYIILDGGSSDGSREIIEKYAQHLSCWRSHPDDGQYAAIDEGFARGRGEIMTWLNGDDILRPGALKAVAAIFRRREEVRWLTGRPNGIDAHGNDTWVLPSLPLWSRRRYLNKQYKTPYIQQEGTFWRRSLWRQAGARMRTDLKLAGDLELWTRFFRHTQLFSADVKLAAFRTHGDQKTNKLLESYDIEAELVLDEEIAQSPCHAQPFHDRAPVPITREKIADYLGRSGMQAGTEKQPNSHAVPSAAVSPQNDEAPVLVSAIVSTYNAENYIRGCLEDLLAQTLADRMEIIVVDSASEQNEGDIVREFQQRFKRLVYIRTKSRESVYAGLEPGHQMRPWKVYNQRQHRRPPPEGRLRAHGGRTGEQSAHRPGLCRRHQNRHGQPDVQRLHALGNAELAAMEPPASSGKRMLHRTPAPVAQKRA